MDETTNTTLNRARVALHLGRSGEPSAPPWRRWLSAPALTAMAVYVGAIITANVVTSRLGLVPVGFGILVTAGTYAAGFALLARDFLQRYGDVELVLIGLAVGAVLSWFLSSPALALASFAAFLLAELADLLVYTRLRTRGFVRAAFISNCAGAPIDTLVFLWIAQFPMTWQLITGQLIGKVFWATVVPLAVFVGGREAYRRRPARGRIATS